MFLGYFHRRNASSKCLNGVMDAVRSAVNATGISLQRIIVSCQGDSMVAHCSALPCSDFDVNNHFNVEYLEYTVIVCPVSISNPTSSVFNSASTSFSLSKYLVSASFNTRMTKRTGKSISSWTWQIVAPMAHVLA